MARERVIACENYICEGKCKEGKEGTFWKKCQKCKSYKPVRGGQPAKIDTRAKKAEDFHKKQMRYIDFN